MFHVAKLNCVTNCPPIPPPCWTLVPIKCHAPYGGVKSTPMPSRLRNFFDVETETHQDGAKLLDSETEISPDWAKYVDN